MPKSAVIVSYWYLISPSPPTAQSMYIVSAPSLTIQSKNESHHLDEKTEIGSKFNNALDPSSDSQLRNCPHLEGYLLIPILFKTFFFLDIFKCWKLENPQKHKKRNELLL